MIKVTKDVTCCPLQAWLFINTLFALFLFFLPSWPTCSEYLGKDPSYADYSEKYQSC